MKFMDELNGYGGGTDGFNLFVKTHDGGETWDYSLDIGLRDVSINNDCDISMVYGSGYYSNEDCQPWYPISANFGHGTFSCIEMTSPTTIFMGGLGWDGSSTFNYSIIARSMDNGDTWSFIEYPFLTSGIYDIEFIDLLTGFAVTQNLLGNPDVGYQTIFLKTIDGGDTWNYQEFSSGDCGQVGSVGHLSCPSDQVCYATGSGGLFRTMNGGGEIYPMPVLLEENTFGESIGISPNPTHGLLNIESFDNITKVLIYNVVGELCFTAAGIDSNTISMDVSALVNGCYIISIETERGSKPKRFVKH